MLPLARVIAPEARFLWNRITPGELGLELTTTLAIGGVGLYVFFLYVMVLSGDPGPDPARPRAARPEQRPELEDADGRRQDRHRLRRVPATALGCGGDQHRARRPRAVGQVAVLVGGFALIYVSVQITKAGIDRPRPEAPLVDTSGSSFPSGHAAYSTAWVAAALMFTRG